MDKSLHNRERFGQTINHVNMCNAVMKPTLGVLPLRTELSSEANLGRYITGECKQRQ